MQFNELNIAQCAFNTFLLNLFSIETPFNANEPTDLFTFCVVLNASAYQLKMRSNTLIKSN